MLTEQQVREIVEHQRQKARPFGLLAERLFKVHPARIEEAWARQYARFTGEVDPSAECFDERAGELVSRRQAWQFRSLPVRFDDHGDLMVATTQAYLRRALGFATNVLGVPAYLVLATPDRLGQALCTHYPLPGMTPECVLDSGMDRLLTMVTSAA